MSDDARPAAAPARRPRPMVLLAVEADGTVAAAWTADAHSPGQLARLCGNTGTRYAADPARYAVTRNDAPAARPQSGPWWIPPAFWAAAARGDLGPQHQRIAAARGLAQAADPRGGAR